MTINIAIIGMGKGGTALLELFAKEPLIVIAGVAETNPAAPGCALAAQQGIPVFDDWRQLIRVTPLNYVINVTGDEHVRDELARKKPAGLSVIDAPVARLVWLLFDAQTRMHRDIQNERNFFDQIFESVANGLVLIDRNRHIFRMNKAALDMLGYQQGEVEGRICHHFFCPADENRCPVFDLGETMNLAEKIAIRRDGTHIPILKTAWRVGFGEKEYLLESFIDISRRKEEEAALKISEERHRVLFESSRDAIMTLEPPSWNFTSGNPSTLQMFGATSEAEFTSHPPWELSPERQPDGRPSPEKSKEMIETAMREGSHFFEWTHKRLDGEEFPATVLLTRMGLAGKMVLQATVRDITEQKRAGEDLKNAHDELKEKNEQLRQFDQLKSEFVANVSHEIKNPLTTIKAAFYLITKEMGDRVSPKQRQILEMGEKTVERLNRLVSDLLDLAKIETGKMKLSWERVEIAALLEDLIIAYSGEFANKGLTIAKKIAPDTGIVIGDRDKLSQVVINLLGNAIKYTPAGGTVALCATGSPEEVRIEITDNGPGIPVEYAERIFDKFERITAEKQEGTGLGLAIAKDIVTLHHGRIWIKSAPDRGSTFIVVLPRDARANVGNPVAL